MVVVIGVNLVNKTIMSKLFLSRCICLVLVLSACSCDRIKSVVSDVVGSNLPTDRRQGISQPHEASADDVKIWLAEPNVLVVLNFYSPDCEVCSELEPKLGAMAEKYSEYSAIMKINVGKPSDAATLAVNEYQIDKTPVLKFFLNGKEVKQLTGDQTTEKLETVFSKYTKKVSGEFTMREGELPGSQQGRTAADMMKPIKKGELPKGITRVRVPDGAKQVTDELPKALNLKNPPQVDPKSKKTQ